GDLASGASPAVALPPLAGPDELAGCLYVVEGASLGGRIIAASVGPRLGLDDNRGCSFFSGDGEEPGRRWTAVLRWLDELAPRIDADRAVAAAAATFLTLGLALGRAAALR
ncbi:MAG: hypothetical protein M3Y59_10550, partial [Myxococcota bacterium]|nr:hypothetical protein [Myxococcota bacterium]